MDYFRHYVRIRPLKPACATDTERLDALHAICSEGLRSATFDANHTAFEALRSSIELVRASDGVQRRAAVAQIWILLHPTEIVHRYGMWFYSRALEDGALPKLRDAIGGAGPHVGTYRSLCRIIMPSPHLTELQIRVLDFLMQRNSDDAALQDGLITSLADEIFTTSYILNHPLVFVKQSAAEHLWYEVTRRYNALCRAHGPGAAACSKWLYDTVATLAHFGFTLRALQDGTPGINATATRYIGRYLRARLNYDTDFRFRLRTVYVTLEELELFPKRRPPGWSAAVTMEFNNAVAAPAAPIQHIMLNELIAEYPMRRTRVPYTPPTARHLPPARLLSTIEKFAIVQAAARDVDALIATIGESDAEYADSIRQLLHPTVLRGDITLMFNVVTILPSCGLRFAAWCLENGLLMPVLNADRIPDILSPCGVLKMLDSTRWHQRARVEITPVTIRSDDEKARVMDFVASYEMARARAMGEAPGISVAAVSHMLYNDVVATSPAYETSVLSPLRWVRDADVKQLFAVPWHHYSFTLIPILRSGFHPPSRSVAALACCELIGGSDFSENRFKSIVQLGIFDARIFNADTLELFIADLNAHPIAYSNKYNLSKYIARLREYSARGRLYIHATSAPAARRDVAAPDLTNARIPVAIIDKVWEFIGEPTPRLNNRAARG